MKSCKKVIEGTGEIIEEDFPERKLREELGYAGNIIETIRAPLVVLDAGFGQTKDLR